MMRGDIETAVDLIQRYASRPQPVTIHPVEYRMALEALGLPPDHRLTVTEFAEYLYGRSGEFS